MSGVGFWHWAQRDPARIAVVEPDGTRVSFGALADRVHRLAHALKALGLQPGDTIATVLRNRSECEEAFLAAFNCGWYYVPINYHGNADELTYILQNAEAKAVIVDAAFAAAVLPAIERAGLPAQARIVAGADAGAGPAAVPGYTPIAAFRSATDASRPDSSIAGQIMQYTSGTTGKPKGVRRPLDPRRSADQAALGAGWLAVFGVQPGGGAHLVTAPLYHSAVHSLSTSALYFGQTVVQMEKWTPERCLELIARERITTTHMVSTHFHRLLQLPDAVRAAADVSSLTHVVHGAVPTPVDTKRRMIEWWGPVIHEYYGSSEVGGTVVGPGEWLKRPGTVGRPFPNSELHILDEAGQELPPGKVGQVWMRQGDEDFAYYKDPDKTARSKRGRLIHVGDFGYVDEEGYLFLSGRDSEIVISGGVNIYPAQIEARLLAHPAVHDCGVIGVPDPEFGEALRAVVVTNPGHEAGPALAQSLIEHCRSALGSLYTPKAVDFAATLPRDPSGKLMKHKLRAPYWAGREKQI
jgi:long-chain acyl-CoA synthetase